MLSLSRQKIRKGNALKSLNILNASRYCHAQTTRLRAPFSTSCESRPPILRPSYNVNTFNIPFSGIMDTSFIPSLVLFSNSALLSSFRSRFPNSTESPSELSASRLQSLPVSESTATQSASRSPPKAMRYQPEFERRGKRWRGGFRGLRFRSFPSFLLKLASTISLLSGRWRALHSYASLFFYYAVLSVHSYLPSLAPHS